MLFGLGSDLLAVSAVIILSTVIPLWAFAKLSQKWLKNDNQDNAAKDKGVSHG